MNGRGIKIVLVDKPVKITGNFPVAVWDTESTILVMWKQLFLNLYPVVFPVKTTGTADAARP